VDYQDFGLATEARPQTAGHAVYVSLLNGITANKMDGRRHMEI